MHRFETLRSRLETAAGLKHRPITPIDRPEMAEGNAAEKARKHPRYPIRLPAFLIRGTRATQLYSRDVSFGGLFLHTNLPPPLRELLRIRIVLPPDQEEVNLLGMAVHRVEPGGTRSPGIGIQLYGNDPQTSRHWDAFIHYIRQHSGEPPEAEAAAWPRAPHALRAIQQRAIRVRIPTLEDLWAIADRDLVRARTAIRTELYFDRGTSVTLELVHPESKKSFSIGATVKEQFRLGPTTGLELDLTVDDDLKGRFSKFLDDEIHISVDLGLLAEAPGA